MRAPPVNDRVSLQKHPRVLNSDSTFTCLLGAAEIRKSLLFGKQPPYKPTPFLLICPPPVDGHKVSPPVSVVVAWQSILLFGFTSSSLHLALHLSVTPISWSHVPQLPEMPGPTARLVRISVLCKVKEEHSPVSSVSSLESWRARSSRLGSMSYSGQSLQRTFHCSPSCRWGQISLVPDIAHL